jgi:hypothetical protein
MQADLIKCGSEIFQACTGKGKASLKTDTLKPGCEIFKCVPCYVVASHAHRAIKPALQFDTDRRPAGIAIIHATSQEHLISELDGSEFS